MLYFNGKQYIFNRKWYIFRQEMSYTVFRNKIFPITINLRDLLKVIVPHKFLSETIISNQPARLLRKIVWGSWQSAWRPGRWFLPVLVAPGPPTSIFKGNPLYSQRGISIFPPARFARRGAWGLEVSFCEFSRIRAKQFFLSSINQLGRHLRRIVWVPGQSTIFSFPSGTQVF